MPPWLRFCFTKALWILGILICIGIVLASGIEPNDLPDWSKRYRVQFACASILSFVTGILGNIAASRFLDWESERAARAPNFFRGHHLAKLVGQSLGMVLRAAAEQLPSAADTKIVISIAHTLEEKWPRISKSKAAQRWLFAIRDRQLIEFIRDPHKPALNYQQAEKLLALGNPDTPGTLPAFTHAESLHAVRTQVILRFGDALRVALEHDFARRGEGAMGILMDICAELLSRSSTQVSPSDDNRNALRQIHRTLHELELAKLSAEVGEGLAALDTQLSHVFSSIHEESAASQRRDRLTHSRLTWALGALATLAVVVGGIFWQNIALDGRLETIERQLTAAIEPRRASDEPVVFELSPELAKKAKLLLERGDREQQALAQIALGRHAEADRIIQTLKKGPLAEAYRLLTLEGDNWYNAKVFERAIEAYDQALALRGQNVSANNRAALAHLFNQHGDMVAHLQRATQLLTNAVTLSSPGSTDWALSQHNLGIALRLHSARTEGTDSTDLLAKSVSAFRAALETFTRRSDPRSWATTQVNLGVSLQTQGNRAEGAASTALLAEAVRAYRSALEVMNRQTRPEDWAMTQSNLASALLTQGERTEGTAGTDLLGEAVSAYRGALEVFNRETFPQNWAGTQNNLGRALLKQGSRTEGIAATALVAKAMSAFRSALQVMTRVALPKDWAMTQRNLGSALLTQGERTEGTAGTALLAEAASAHRAALEVFTRQTFPQNWAGTQNSLGIALRAQGERTEGTAGTALLAEAASAHRAALEVFTRQTFPQNWAGTQNNLGNALLAQGKRTGGTAGTELLAEAVNAYRAALEVFTRRTFPQDWARAQSNLGIALRAQGERTEGATSTALLSEAARGFRAALGVFTRGTSPQNWATTQNNLGSALLLQGKRTGDAAGTDLLAAAVSAHRSTLDIFNRRTFPQNWAGTQNNLGIALQAQGERSDGATSAALLEEAVTAFHAALKIFTRRALPQKWAMTQNNLGVALLTEGERAEGAVGNKVLAEAASAFRAALEVYARPNLSQGWAAGQNNLGVALRAQGERTDGAAGTALLAEAVSVFRAALEVYTRQGSPQGWATTQDNLGNALRAQGERASGGAVGTELLGEAVTAFRAALEVRSRSARPQDWAETQKNLGSALQALGERTDGIVAAELFAKAIRSYCSALEIYTNTGFPWHHARVAEKLARTNSLLKAQGGPTLGLTTDLASCRSLALDFSSTRGSTEENKKNLFLLLSIYYVIN